MSTKIRISHDFTTTPGARYVTDGPFSGELFRKQFLEPHFLATASNQIINIDLDGVVGYGTSFLEEAFGGLARIYGKDLVMKRLTFKSEEDPLLIQEITDYIERCNEGR